MKYYLFDPTGNITALIADDTPADVIMKKHPECEQAGYIEYRDGSDICLRMAGGEFCGNATMCAAFLTGKKNVKVLAEGTGIVNAQVSGDEVRVEMPRPLEITEKNGYPMVRFKGIDHVIIEDDLDPGLIRQWCEGEAIGFMYLKGTELKPLVYVKGADTLFWENSCGSGTCAVGEWLDKPVEIRNPAGILKYENGCLIGHVKLIKAFL